MVSFNSISNTAYTASLLGAGSGSSALKKLDLVSGERASLFNTSYSPLAAALLPKNSLTSPLQSGALRLLSEFVDANISGKTALRLHSDIAGLSRLAQITGENKANNDPVFSLLSGYGEQKNIGSILDILS